MKKFRVPWPRLNNYPSLARSIERSVIIFGVRAPLCGVVYVCLSLGLAWTYLEAKRDVASGHGLCYYRGENQISQLMIGP
jgi:hypothetical protein